MENRNQKILATYLNSIDAGTMKMTELSLVEPWLWPAFIGMVLVLLALDLLVFNKKSHIIKTSEAVKWSIFWISIALIFNGWFAYRHGNALGMQFLTGYLIELSLSVDNLFVILLVFKSFKIPAQYQHRVLFWGILGAVVFRGIMIILGVDLLHRFHWLLYAFGGVLIFSAIKFLFESDEKKEVTESPLVIFLEKNIPFTNKISGSNFFVRISGKLKATPLFLVLLVVEVTDLVFAVDSVPAVISVTPDAFVAFGSNIMAILGLRSLYFLVADLIHRFRYLKPGLSTILGFVGVKMILSDFFPIPTGVSLLVILMVLVTAALSSWYVDRKSDL